jgi:hypothetical protein
VTRAAPTVGAYGLRVTGIDAGNELLGPVPDHLPPLHMAYRQEQRGFEGSSIDDDQATLVLDNHRGLLVDRGTSRATYSGPRLPTPADCVHPLLTAAAAAMGRWSGYEHFHASAFVAQGRAWGLLGGKESGKSTTAAWLGEKGYPILCDDMLTMRARTAFAGPRCVDLRPEPARRLGIGVPADTDGPRERWRVGLSAIVAEAPLGGWLFLEWGDVAGVRPLGPGDVLRRLAASRTWRGFPADPVTLLDLAALPAWELRRPRSWASFETASASVEAVIRGLSSQVPIVGEGE